MSLWRKNGSLYSRLSELDVSSEGTDELFVRNVEKNVGTHVNPAGELI